jgi:hypothetical protein
MSFVLRRLVRVLRAGTPLAIVAGLACSTDSLVPQQPKGFSAAYGLWTPGPGDTCTKEIHDQYSVVGPDGLLYPTWHPPVDPATGCSFGHEHGRDPRGSNLYKDVGPIPFGYANQQLDVYDPANPRHEDHFGHKVEWANDIHLHFNSDAADQLFDITCDVLVKMHQGTHSKDAFTNNLHELAYHIKCSDGTELHVTELIAIGTPGEFVRSCNGDSDVVVGTAAPANSPDGGGRRIIPDRVCANQLLVPAGQTSNWDLLHESWQTSNSVEEEGGHGLAFFNPYFQVFLPSRFYDPSAANITGRPIDVCYWVGPNGERARGGPCQASTNNGVDTGVGFNNPRSEFNGAHRVVDINSTVISNRGGPKVWYTDPFGRHGRTAPFPGSIRQVIAQIDNDLNNIFPSGPGIGQGRPYSGQGVHSPN